MLLLNLKISSKYDIGACYISVVNHSPENGEINEMTLPSRHRILNLSPGSLSPSTLPLGHGGSPQY